MERIFMREKSPFEKSLELGYMDRVNVAVTGLGRGDGSTFFATALAFYYVENGEIPNFIQCLNPSESRSLLYDEAGMDMRFSYREFHDFYSMIKDEKPLKGKTNMESGINWILPTPSDCEERIVPETEHRDRLVHCGRGKLTVFDIEASEKWDRFLPDMDLLFAVCDPLPSKLIRASERFRKIKKLEFDGLKVRWVVNRMNDGVNRREVTKFLHSSDIIYVPFFSPDVIYSDEFFCRFHCQNKAVRPVMMDIFTKNSHDIPL